MNRNGPSHAHGHARRVKTSRAGALGVRQEPERRSVGEAAIVDLLLGFGWAELVAQGDRDSAEREARQTLDRLIERGLGFRCSASGERRFDPAEVTNFVQWISLEHGDRFWLDRCVPAGRSFVWAAHGLEPRADSCPPPPTALGPRRFKVRFRRLFNLNGFQPGAIARLRLPLPIEDEALGDLKVETLPSPDLEVAFTVAEARLDARIRVPAEPSVELGFDASFTAYPSGGTASSAPLSAMDAELYTRPNEGLIKVSRRTRRLASAITGAETDAWAQVERFWNYMFDRLRAGAINYDELDLSRPNEWILRNRWCDCQLASAFMACLCRAQGIPARLIGGYVMDDHTPYSHYWTEAWISGRGWTPLDMMGWYFSGRGRDRHWRDYYLGRLDYRMKTEVLPRLFNGAGSIRLPAAWYRLSRVEDGGLACGFYTRDGGALVYGDHVSIVPNPAGAT